MGGSVFVREFNEIIDRVLISRREEMAERFQGLQGPALPPVVAAECLHTLDDVIEELLEHCKREGYFVPNIDGYVGDILEIYYRDVEKLAKRQDPAFDLQDMRTRIAKDVEKRLFLLTKGIVRRKYIYKPTTRAMFVQSIDNPNGGAKTFVGGVAVACVIAMIAWYLKHKVGLY